MFQLTKLYNRTLRLVRRCIVYNVSYKYVLIIVIFSDNKYVFSLKYVNLILDIGIYVL